MSTTYWLDLFSGETWNEFLKAGATVSGFRATQKKTAERVKVGDRFVCYVVGIGRFIGVLEITSPVKWDETPIWATDPFPVRFGVKPLVTVEFNEAVPVLALRDKLKMLADHPGVKNFGFLFQGSLRRLALEDGVTILAELERQQLSPVIRPVDEKKLFKKTLFELNRAQTDKGEVTVPQKDEPTPSEKGSPPNPEVTTHTEIQWTLLKMGADMGLDVWVASNDKTKEYKGQSFGKAPRLLKSLPNQFTNAVQKTIELIDVLWLKNNVIVGAFEIESTTSIYSGLLRMSDLISMQPNLTIPLYIVAPDERRSKVMEEINRPTFANLPKPMTSVCRYVAFSDLKEAVMKNQGVISYLPPEYVWEEVAESCELSPV